MTTINLDESIASLNASNAAFHARREGERPVVRAMKAIERRMRQSRVRIQHMTLITDGKNWDFGHFPTTPEGARVIGWPSEGESIEAASNRLALRLLRAGIIGGEM